MQVLHILDALVAWWVSQDLSGRTTLRSAPIDVVFEGLIFALAALHLRVSMALGQLGDIDDLPQFEVGDRLVVPLETLLSVSVASSLAAVAVALVIWDSNVSIKLSRDMYGWPGQRVGAGLQRCGQFLAHLSLRGSEVAGKSVLLVMLAVLGGVGFPLRYTGACYLGGFLALLSLSTRKATPTTSPTGGGTTPLPIAATPVAVPPPWPLTASLVLAWPLLFANLPQFVDCPRHARAASQLAGFVCGFRALEIAVALSAVVMAILLEDEVMKLSAGGLSARPSPPSAPEASGVQANGIQALRNLVAEALATRPSLGPGLGLGLSGAAAGGAEALLQAWRALYDRSATVLWAMCLLLHYLCMVWRWCGFCGWADSEYIVAPVVPVVPPPHRIRGVGGVNVVTGGSVPLSRVASPPRSGTRSPLLGAMMPREEKDFWPLAIGLAPLLLAAACERAPLAWPLDRAASGSAGGLDLSMGRSRGGGPIGRERPLRMEDFDTIRLIGSGEFGKVYQVRQRSTQEVFAMKRLSKEFYSRRRMSDKAIREIATLHLARDHPFVVRLMYTIENAREWALVMEYLPHGDLQQLLLTEGCPGLPLSRTVRISAEVALALEHLHARGIVFRDLKLENVVLDRDGHAKLTDFGLAKQHRGGRDAISEAEQAGDVYCSFTKTFCGSYGYAAPEVNPRRQVHGFAADMYSYGVFMLMLLMGGEVYHDTREPPWERRLPPETPKDLRNIINNLTFEFYWGSHHFLAPARATHRVEVNLNGTVVLVSTGPRGARRQERPRKPPSSPRSPRGLMPGGPSIPELGAPGGAPGQRPAQFPLSACQPCEVARRRWELALDLVRVLTNEFPEQRGTVARVKQHPFFAEEIVDWRTVYPKSWLLERVRAKLLALFGWASLPNNWEQQLQRLSSEELTSLQDEPAAYVELLEQAASAATPEPAGSAAAASAAPGSALLEDLPSSSPGSASHRHARSSSSQGRSRDSSVHGVNEPWVAHYT